MEKESFTLCIKLTATYPTEVIAHILSYEKDIVKDATPIVAYYLKKYGKYDCYVYRGDVVGDDNFVQKIAISFD